LPFIRELKRRHVFKVGVAYLAIAWLLAQVLDLAFDAFDTPAWVMKTVLALLAAGFVPALLLAWVYELTPGGISKDPGPADAAPRTAASGRGLLYATLVALLFGGITFFLTREQAPAERAPGIETLIARPSVMVLPFANISGEAANDYLAFGITEELISGLQRLGDFPVVSRSAALAYDAGAVSAMDYAQSHGASYLLEGSVNAGPEGIRILANLSRTQGEQVWAERYQLAAGQAEIFDVSDQLVSKVAGAVLESEVKRVDRKDRPPADAWEHYVKGLKVVLEYAPEDYAEAREHLDRAVEIAPDMAEAWWAIGELEELKSPNRWRLTAAPRPCSDLSSTFARPTNSVLFTPPLAAASATC
jgi:TolB-like protein